jgi:hypothetical protein
VPVHITKAYSGNRDIPPTILNLSTRQRQEVNFTPQRLQPQVLMEQGAGWAPETVWMFGEQNNLLVENQTFYQTAHTTVPILATPSHLLWTHSKVVKFKFYYCRQQEHTMPRVK